MVKIIRTATIAPSLNILLKGQLRFLNSYYSVIAVSGQDDYLTEVNLREGVKTVDVSMQRTISPYKDLISLFRLIRLFRQEKPTIVHSITPKAGLLTMLAGKIAGVPIRMHTFTGLIFPTKTGFFQSLLIKMDKLLCWAATHVYPEGNGVKQDLTKFKITTKPLKVLGNGNVNGIDLEYYSNNQITNDQRLMLKHELNISDLDFVFVFVGRLVGDKGINELVDAFSALKISNVKLLLVGPFEDDLDPLLPKTLKEIEDNINIISVGVQQDIRPYLAISHALAFPSYREGFPNVVIQAGAMDLPCIVTNINGSNEIIHEDINGIIISVKDIHALQKAMIKMVTDTGYFISLKMASRALIVSRYEQAIVWNALLAEYNKLINLNSNV